MKIRFFSFTLMAALLAGFSVIAQGQQGRSRFAVTVDSLISEIDIQIEDRAKLIKLVNDLYKKLKNAEIKSLDRQVVSARRAAIQREALVTADQMALDPKGNARVTELIEFLDRVVTRDEQLYDHYVSSKQSVRFEYERQLAKIKSEQTVLKNIRRDLEKLKRLPGDKEQAQFFLRSVKTLLDGLKSVHTILE